MKPALTPDLALDYLGELSTDIRAGVVIDSQGDLAAVTGDDRDRGEKMRTLALELLDAAGEGFDQAEVVTLEGSVFVVRGEGWTVAVVAGRQPLASLMFHDLRNVGRERGGGSVAAGSGGRSAPWPTASRAPPGAAVRGPGSRAWWSTTAA